MSPTIKLSEKYSEKNGSSCYIDPESMHQARKPGYHHKLAALDYVKFRVPGDEQNQYLDLGCGFGGFTRDALLEHVRPCHRIVGVDRSETLIKYAREHATHPDICYEVVDIEEDDPQVLLNKYGPFDRIYSFLVLQCVRNLKAAYQNMFHLLKDGGECALVTLTGSVITDVMYQLNKTEEWKGCIPDPRALYSERFFLCEPINEEKVVSMETKALRDTGLELVSCSVYDSMWTLPDIDAWIDTYVPVFKLEANIPEERRLAFRRDCRKLLEAQTTTTSDGCTMRHSFVVVHAQKSTRNSPVI